MMRYDWRGVLTGKYHWRNIYKAIRDWKPEASRLEALWLTIRFPHVHEEGDD